MLVSAEEVQTPLQRQVAQLSKWLVILALAVVAAVFVVGVLRGLPFEEMLLVSLSLAVAAVPEGLPAVITIALSNGASRMVKRNEELFPGVADTSAPNFFAGLRPSTPDNVPYIGRSKIANLWLNTGHGTLGWTHGAGSGQALAELMSGKRPALAFRFCGEALPPARPFVPVARPRSS